jgi:GT2 family glycosyltransferase
MSIAAVVLTYNRVHLLEQCVERVIGRASELTSEVVIWNNGSSDGTGAFLESLDDPRISVVNQDRNIGPNAYDEALSRTRSDYIVELDDDVIDAPPRWDEALLRAFERLPGVGLLSANLANNPHDVTAGIMYGVNADLYRVEEVNGVSLKIGGPIGGGCAITSREIYDRVGGFGHNRRSVFWCSDAVFMKKLGAVGLRGAYLNDLEVVHAGGAFYAPVSEEKEQFWKRYDRHARRRQRVKRVLLSFPYVRSLNDRHKWFVPPGPDYPFLR